MKERGGNIVKGNDDDESEEKKIRFWIAFCYSFVWLWLSNHYLCNLLTFIYDHIFTGLFNVSLWSWSNIELRLLIDIY